VITDITKHNPFAFRGTVAEAGYEWVKARDGKQRLVPRHVPGIGFRAFQPQPGLFRAFANLGSTRDAIRGFAEQHGDMFTRYEPQQSAVRADGTVTHGASFVTWTQEIEDMRVLVDIWEHIQRRQIAELKRVIKWNATEVGYVIKTPKRERDVTLAHADISESGLSRFSPKDVVLPARCALQLEINVRLGEHPTVPRLSWTPDTRDTSGDYRQRIIFTPPNLLAAMWLQFAQAVTGEFQLMVCEGCGKYFQVGPGGRRADSTTCSDACRQRKNRKDKKTSA
jgi:hypothetical protein